MFTHSWGPWYCINAGTNAQKGCLFVWSSASAKGIVCRESMLIGDEGGDDNWGSLSVWVGISSLGQRGGSGDREGHWNCDMHIWQ